MKLPPFLLSILTLSSPLAADVAADATSLSNSHTQFAFSLYPNIETSDDNLVFSPYSIASCLSMVYVGARGDTETQMESALHLDIDRKAIAKAAFSLSQSMGLKGNEENGYQLNMANAVFVDQGTFLLSDFRYAIVEQFKAKLGILNFSQSANAVKAINNWIASQTQDKIKDLLSANDVNANTKLVLANAVYFQGKWTSPFNAKATQDWPFHPTAETTTTVKMMQQTFSTPYYENELMQALALPFVGTANSGGQLACVILLPKSADNFSIMVQELPDSFKEWVSSLKAQRISLKLPKFSLSSRFDLAEPLKHLGMEDAFDDDANFAGIDGMRNLIVSKVIHEAVFDLDENGVVAAAATTTSMGATGFPSEPPIAMTVDHPFLFFIVDLKSQEMLFMGKVAQPVLQP
jgi:serpin B